MAETVEEDTVEESIFTFEAFEYSELEQLVSVCEGGKGVKAYIELSGVGRDCIRHILGSINCLRDGHVRGWQRSEMVVVG